MPVIQKLFRFPVLFWREAATKKAFTLLLVILFSALSETFADVAGLASVAILNGMEFAAKPPQGQLVKVVR